MKKISLIIVSLLVVLVCCKKTPQVNIQYVDVEREVLTIGATTANIQCDYEYIATLKSAKLYYGRSESNMYSVNMRVVQSALYAEITGLSASTTYKYYYEFENGFNSMQSEVKTFVTENSSSIVLPTIITADVSEITNNSATCGGQVTDNGGGNVTARGICWSISANPTISDSHSTDGSGLGTFTSNMAGLSSNTTYHVRAYAINEAGTAYGLEKTFTTLDGGGTIELPVVVTSEVVGITAHGASCGGNVVSDGGAEVTDRGICWSTNANPTITNSHIVAGNGVGTFAATVTGLSSSTTYHVRAYATNEAGTAYGLEKTFTTLNGGGNNHEWVDLDLPSGTLWATCNVGANSPEEYGDYFAWGETRPKTSYGWNTYIYCNGDSDQLTKYCSNFLYGYNGFTDSLTVLLPEDDAAMVNWGADWCMPSESQMMELINSTTVTWASLNGVIGFLFTADNGNSLFLPAAGQIIHNPSNPYLDGRCCYYRTNALDVTIPDGTWTLLAYLREDLSFVIRVESDGRNYGESVRPVRTTPTNK